MFLSEKSWRILDDRLTDRHFIHHLQRTIEICKTYFLEAAKRCLANLFRANLPNWGADYVESFQPVNQAVKTQPGITMKH